MTYEEVEQGVKCCAEFECGMCPYKKFDHIDYKLRCIHLLIKDIYSIGLNKVLKEDSNGTCNTNNIKKYGK